MPLWKDPLQRECHTIGLMIKLYCRAHHQQKKNLCPECNALLGYALQRIAKCPFQAEKPACAACTIHCYKSDMREQVRRVMRYAGPRMMIRHPLLAIRHLFDQRTDRSPKKEH